MEPYLHQFSALEYTNAENFILRLFWIDFHFIWWGFSIINKELVPELYLLMLLFRTNLESNICAKEPKKHHLYYVMPNFHVLSANKVQM